SLSLTKRHYTKGYYFAHNHNKKAPGHLISTKEEKYPGVVPEKRTELIVEENIPARTFSTEIKVTDIATVTAGKKKKNEITNIPAQPVMFKIRNADDHVTTVDLTQLNKKKVGTASSGN